MTDPAEPGETDGALARDTAAITVLNLVSRLTGFARVVAMGAALGTTSLGDTYQAANLVSNVLFELLAGGILSAVLVPVFVERIRRRGRGAATELAGVVVARASVALGAVVVLMVLTAPVLMRILTSGVPDGAVRDAQVELGTFLLWFFLPQIVLYGVGAVSTALLQADHRFVAAALAPVANNVVVIGTMLAFRSMRGDDVGLVVGSAEKLVLAGGTTAGVVAMSVLPLVAAARGGLGIRPRWRADDVELRPVVAQGLWSAGHLGLNQVLVAVTVVLAARVSGGVVAYQIAFTFFLLPHAVLANPVFTALYPRLAASVVEGHHERFARQLATGMVLTLLVVLPASAALFALAGPAVAVVRLGNLDAAGAELVADALAGYAPGLAGYSIFFLLTRAAYALGDVRGPAMVNAVAVASGAVGMAIASAAARDNARVAVLGLVHALVVTVGSLGLFGRIRRRIGAVPIGSAPAQALVAAAVAALVARAVVVDADLGSRSSSAIALVVGSGAVVVVYGLGALRATRAELPRLRALWGPR